MGKSGSFNSLAIGKNGFDITCSNVRPQVLCFKICKTLREGRNGDQDEGQVLTLESCTEEEKYLRRNHLRDHTGRSSKVIMADSKSSAYRQYLPDLSIPR